MVQDKDAQLLETAEVRHLTSQTVISSGQPNEQVGTRQPGRAWGGRRRPPYAFTEHGALQLASVLRSEVAVKICVQVVRAFVRMREMVSSQDDLAQRLAVLERRMVAHDHKFKQVFEAIRQLAMEPPKPKRQMGFTKDKKRRTNKNTKDSRE